MQEIDLNLTGANPLPKAPSAFTPVLVPAPVPPPVPVAAVTPTPPAPEPQTLVPEYVPPPAYVPQGMRAPQVQAEPIVSAPPPGRLVSTPAPRQGGLMVPAGIAASLPGMVRDELAQMDALAQERFIEEFRRKSRSTGVVYLAWFFLGWHYAFLGKWGWQWLYWCTAAGSGFWGFIDLFRIPGMVRDYNRDVAIETLRNMRALGR
ncbi:MAG: TM2 domain-containing protein [Armatimonas sp.]